MVGTSSTRTFESVAFVKLQIIHLLNLNLQCNVPLTRVRPLANTGLLSCGLSKLPGNFGNVRVQSGGLHPPLGGLHPPPLVGVHPASHLKTLPGCTPPAPLIEYYNMFALRELFLHISGVLSDF